MYHLPSYYDILNTPGTFEDINLYEQIANRFGILVRKWLEPGCGSGRHLRVLAKRGYQTTGFDCDKQMLDYARKSLKQRGLSSRLFCAGMDDFIKKLRNAKFDIAINPHSTIRHLLNERAICSHLNQIAATLSPGGIYIVGISLARYGKDQIETDLWLTARGRCHVRQDIQYRPPERGGRFEQVLSTLTITSPNSTKKHVDGYRLRTYGRKQWDETLSRSGLTTLAVLDESGDDVTGHDLPYYLYVLSSASAKKKMNRPN